MSSITLTQRRPSLSAEGSKPGKTLEAINTFGGTFEAPNTTIKEVLDAIPPHCYKRSTIRGLSYVFRDLFFIGLFGYIAYSYFHVIPWFSARVIAWSIYSIVQGLFGTGIWVLAHECGHGAFSDSKAVNDTVGWILHSSLLVPYHSWRLSHSKHHKATGHLTRDTVFLPKSKETFFNVRRISEITEDAPIYTLYLLVLQQLFGWPMYLLTNATGQPYRNRSKYVRNHFVPTSPLFEARDFWNIVISDIGVAITLSAIIWSVRQWGFTSVLVYYLIPWLWVNHWLVCITYLQHSHPLLPHYDAEDWNFVRGAAATVDRDFGFIGKHILHDIIETHVLHHFVSRIPFYNGREGTEAIKKVLGKHYVHDDTPMIKALYTTARTCQFVEGDNGIKMFRNINNIGVTPYHPGKKLSE